MLYHEPATTVFETLTAVKPEWPAIKPSFKNYYQISETGHKAERRREFQAFTKINQTLSCNKCKLNLQESLKTIPLEMSDLTL